MDKKSYGEVFGSIQFSDIESEQHIGYVQGYTKILATQYAKLYPKSRMTAGKIEKIVRAAGLHDIGKLAVPDWILLKAGKLSEEELNILKAHTLKGGEILKVLGQSEDEEYNRICYNICVYHHERYDGTGYPFGLKKDKIPIEAQFVALADMYDILIHGTEERQVFTKEEAFQMLTEKELGGLAPRLKECFLYAKEDMETYSIID